MGSKLYKRAFVTDCFNNTYSAAAIPLYMLFVRNIQLTFACFWSFSTSIYTVRRKIRFVWLISLTLQWFILLSVPRRIDNADCFKSNSVGTRKSAAFFAFWFVFMCFVYINHLASIVVTFCNGCPHCFLFSFYLNFHLFRILVLLYRSASEDMGEVLSEKTQFKTSVVSADRSQIFPLL